MIIVIIFAFTTITLIILYLFPSLETETELYCTSLFQETYESFHYTSLVYLNDYGKDFKGGRFYFMQDLKSSTKNTTVEPRAGRILMFTSGSENPHAVERVLEGTRFAITVSFTCDTKLAIDDSLQN